MHMEPNVHKLVHTLYILRYVCVLKGRVSFRKLSKESRQNNHMETVEGHHNYINCQPWHSQTSIRKPNPMGGTKTCERQRSPIMHAHS